MMNSTIFGIKIKWLLLIIATSIGIRYCWDSSSKEEVQSYELWGTYISNTFAANGDQLMMKIDIGEDDTYNIGTRFRNSDTGKLTDKHWSGKIDRNDYKFDNSYLQLKISGWLFGDEVVEDAVLIFNYREYNTLLLRFEIDPTQDQTYGRVWTFKREGH